VFLLALKRGDILEFEGKKGEDGDWKLHDGIISKKGRLYVGIAAAIRKKVMEEFHNTPIGGHSGMQSTYQRIKRGFYWPGMKREICSFVRECDVCQRNKGENVALAFCSHFPFQIRF
jgi:hypothetical protein